MKIFIFGPPGSGKTTLAKKLHSDLRIPLYTLDDIFWNREKGTKNYEERKNIIKKILLEKEWIIEGLYKDNLLQFIVISADIICILTPFKILNYWRILKRTIYQLLELNVSIRTINWNYFLKFLYLIHSFEYNHKKVILKYIDTKQKIIYLKTDKDIKNINTLIQA